MFRTFPKIHPFWYGKSSLRKALQNQRAKLICKGVQSWCKGVLKGCPPQTILLIFSLFSKTFTNPYFIFLQTCQGSDLNWLFLVTMLFFLFWKSVKKCMEMWAFCLKRGVKVRRKKLKKMWKVMMKSEESHKKNWRQFEKKCGRLWWKVRKAVKKTKENFRKSVYSKEKWGKLWENIEWEKTLQRY